MISFFKKKKLGRGSVALEKLKPWTQATYLVCDSSVYLHVTQLFLGFGFHCFLILFWFWGLNTKTKFSNED